MPSTVTGLLILLVSLAPGYVYLLLAERQGPPLRTHSVFRETAQVVLTSVVCLSATMVLFGIAKWTWPRRLPNVSQLIRDPSLYWQVHYVEALLWSGGLLLVACLLAYIWGAHALGRVLGERVRKYAPGRFLWPMSGTEFVSTWSKLFETAEPDSYRYVRCHLIDGSRVEGWLWTFNAQVLESADREFALGGPITVTDSDGTIRTNSDGAVSVSARSILMLEVSYHNSLDLDSS